MKTRKKTAKMLENNVAAVYVGVSLSVNIPTLFFFAHKLCLSFFSETFLLVSIVRKSGCTWSSQKKLTKTLSKDTVHTI